MVQKWFPAVCWDFVERYYPTATFPRLAVCVPQVGEQSSAVVAVRMWVLSPVCWWQRVEGPTKLAVRGARRC